MQNTAKKRKHAALIRITAREGKDNELPLVLAYGNRLEAEADLEDALAGVEPEVADHADVEQVVPVLGRMVFAAGKIKSIQQAWLEDEEKEALRRGIMLTWSWHRSLHSPEMGKCAEFFAGTRDSGPLVHWSASDGYWRRLKSMGNYGKNWACGGNWQNELLNGNDTLPEGAKTVGNKVVYESFHDCNAELFEAVMNVIKPGHYREAVQTARARLESSKLRETAARHRSRSINHRKSAAGCIHPNQKEQHLKQALKQDAIAEKFEASAAQINPRN